MKKTREVTEANEESRSQAAKSPVVERAMSRATSRAASRYSESPEQEEGDPFDNDDYDIAL